jgi:nucleoside-diphosphate-sugar epimerase
MPGDDGARPAAATYRGVPVLVLGGAGFVGRWVARLLTAAGADLSLGVRDRASADPVLDRYEIRGHVVPFDVRDGARVAETIRARRPAVTFNLVGYGVEPSQRDPEIARATNATFVRVLGEILADARDPGWPGNQLVHAGTALEYGSAADVGEDAVPCPTSSYGSTKLAGTRLLTATGAARGLRGVTVRLFTVYGPGEHPGRLLPSLIRTAGSGDALPLTSGRQRRDFTYVADAAEGLLRVGLAPAPPGDVVNLATGRLTSVRVFAETAARALGIPPDRLRFGALPTRPDEMEHHEVPLDRLRKLIGWVPPTDVTLGILDTMAHEARVARDPQIR